MTRPFDVSLTRPSYCADLIITSTAGTPDTTPLVRYIQRGVRQSPVNFHTILGVL
jgi:hypothetical protein